MKIMCNLSQKLKVKGSGNMKISPSILNVYDTNLDEALVVLEKVKADFLHVDVMDNIFVPNHTFNHEFVAFLKNKTNLILDTHLMIINPDEEYQKYIDAGTTYLTFHLEATSSPLELIKKIKKGGAKAGVSIKPNTKIEELLPLLEEVDLVLVMSVEPGFGGQAFNQNAVEKIAYLNSVRHDKQLSFLIEVDGGINLDTAKLVKDAGCDIIVVGSYLMKSSDIENTYKKLKEL